MIYKKNTIVPFHNVKKKWNEKKVEQDNRKIGPICLINRRFSMHALSVFRGRRDSVYSWMTETMSQRVEPRN